MCSSSIANTKGISMSLEVSSLRPIFHTEPVLIVLMRVLVVGIPFVHNKELIGLEHSPFLPTITMHVKGVSLNLPDSKAIQSRVIPLF